MVLLKFFQPVKKACFGRFRDGVAVIGVKPTSNR